MPESPVVKLWLSLNDMWFVFEPVFFTMKLYETGIPGSMFLLVLSMGSMETPYSYPSPMLFISYIIV